MLNILKNLYELDDNQEKYIFGEKDKDVEYGKVNIHLINSDYTTGFKIKRDVLHSLLVHTYNIYSRP